MNDRVLVVDGDAEHCHAGAAILSSAGYDVDAVTDAEAALTLAREKTYQAMLVGEGDDPRTPLKLCALLAAVCPRVPLLFAARTATVESVAAAFRAGACDYLRKPLDARQLTCRVVQATCQADVRRQLDRVNALDFDDASVTSLRGSSAAMRELRRIVSRVARGDGPVLVGGETGTGKELVARQVHAQSGRASTPFVAVNCAAVPETLIESELFGHVRGAFTDARSARPGLFALAHGGTLFLDEIGEMSPAMQSKLLRALQERRARPVGGQHEVEFDVRVMAATHRDLDHAVAQGTFRQDLFYRISVFPVMLPSLRERRDDVLELASYFLARTARRYDRPRLRLSLSAAETLLAYEFPGNVRELENAMERAVALARFDQVVVDDLPERMQKANAPAEHVTELLTVEELQHQHVLRVMSLVSGNKSKAAHLLQVDRRTLQRKMRLRDDASPQASSDGTAAPFPVFGLRVIGEKPN